MGTVIIEFSPTGGTDKVAQVIAQAWGGTGRVVDLTDPKTDFSACEVAPGDRVIIAMPVFGGTAPRVALERLGKIRGNGAACALVAVYGNRAFEHALADMGTVARSCGFTVVAGVAGVAEHSIARQFATDRPDAQDVTDLRGIAARIAEKGLGETAMPGGPSAKKGGDGGANMLLPKPTRDCTRCGACAAACPVEAIDPTTLQADLKSCIDCMRCVARCPAKARKVSGAALVAVGAMLRKACSERKEPELFI